MERHDGTNARGLESGGIEEVERELEEDLDDPATYLRHLCDQPEPLRRDEIHDLAESILEERATLRAELEAVRRERDEWKAKHDTLADVSRSCIATAERERDAAVAAIAASERRAAEADVHLSDAESRRRTAGSNAIEWESRAKNAERALAAAGESADAIRAMLGGADDLVIAVRCLADRAEKAEEERDALRHHYDKAGPEHNLLALLDMYDERRVAAESERDEACAECDARPDISAEDAELFSRTSHTVSQTIEDRIPGYADAMSRIASALQGHAEKAVKS